MTRLQHRSGDPLFDGFLRAMAVLISGTAGAHFITAAALPVLSRLYGPGDFGTLAVFTGIIATIAVAACMRYDVAVALPESEQDALALLVLSLGCAAVAACVSLLVVVGLAPWLARWDSSIGQSPASWLIPCGVFVAASWSALQNWNIRLKGFAHIARVRIGQALAGGGLQIGMGLAGGGIVGLLSGPVAGFAVGVTFMLLRLRLVTPSFFSSCSATRLRRVAWEYRRFPLYSTWEALANNAAIHIPIILIATVSSKAEAGYLMLAMYAMQAPMSLIGNATSQVYLSRAPEAHRRGELSSFTAELLATLARVGVGPIVAIGIISPAIFALVFGSEWARAGWLVTWMTTWFAFQFLASPVSMALHVTGNQRAAMLLQICGLVIRVLAVIIASNVAPSRVAEWYSMSGGVVYFAYLAVVVLILKLNSRMILRVAVNAILSAVPWATVAWVIAVAVEYLVTRPLL